MQPGKLHIVYQEYGGRLEMPHDRETPREYRIVDPRTGTVTATGHLAPGEAIEEDAVPAARVVIFY